MAAATFTNFSTFHRADSDEVGGQVEASAHPRDVAHVELLHPGQVRVPVGAGRDPTGARGRRPLGRSVIVSLLSGAYSASVIIRRRVSSNQRGSSGPPNETLPRDAGGCADRPSRRRPQLGARQAAAPGAAHEVRHELGRPVAARASAAVSTLIANAAQPTIGNEVGGASELRRGLGAAPAAGGGGVGERHQPDSARPDVAGVVTHCPRPRHVGCGWRPRCRRARRAPAPSFPAPPVPDRPAPVPARATTTASMPPPRWRPRSVARPHPRSLRPAHLPRRRTRSHGASSASRAADSQRPSSAITRHVRAPRSWAPPDGSTSANTEAEPGVAGPVRLLGRLRRHERRGHHGVEHVRQRRPRRWPGPPPAGGAARSRAASEPPAKITLAAAPANVVARRGTRPPARAARAGASTARAPAGGRRVRAGPRPRVPPGADAWVTMRVTAIGDMAFTTTPGGARPGRAAT